MKRRAAVIVGIVVLASMLGACGGPDRKDIENLRAAIAKTA